MKKSVLLPLCLFVLIVNLFAQSPVYNFKPKDKKMIVLHASTYFDWAPDLAKNLPTMQVARPYIDGLAFHVGADYGGPSFGFNNEVWTETSLKFNDLRTISTKWTSLTDNFILVWGHSRNINPDFYNDVLWTQIIANTELLGKAVMTAGCKGILFDPEFYSAGETYSPWWYSKSNTKGTPPYSGKSFSDVKLKARQRGKEYVQALQKYMPKITIMTTFLYGYCWDYCYGDIVNQPASEYALLPAFADGMLEALNSESILVDGNETAYYTKTSRHFVENHDANYTHVRIEATPKVCDPSLLSKWNKQGQVGMATYLEYCYNRYSPKEYSTPTYQSNWMKHNVYHGLLTSDQYMWTYIESMNFWTGLNSPANVNVAEDIRDAVTKFKNSESLGYDIYSTGGEAQFITSPAVTITSPANNFIINNAGNITINASVSPSTGVSKVVFYANSLKIGESTTPPYTITRNFLNADYTIFARQFNASGTHTTSAPVNLFSNNVITSIATANLNELGIYPNPSNSIVNISDNYSEDEYEILSIEGSSLQSGKVKNGSISIENLKSGIYLIKLKTIEGEIFQRIVRE